MPSPALPWSILHPHPTPRPALTAIPPSRPQQPDREERTERHLRACRELFERGMTLARAASNRALQDMAAAPPTMPIPGSAAGAIERAEERARHRTPDYARTFAHIARAVRQTMLLEAYIADGCPPAHRAEADPTQSQRRQPNSPAVNEAAPRPHAERLRRETLERLDCDLPAGPHSEATVEHLLHTIADTLGQDARPAHATAAGQPGTPRTRSRQALRPLQPHAPETARQTIDPPARRGRRW